MDKLINIFSATYKDLGSFHTPSHFQRLGIKSARRMKGQGRSTAKKQTTLLRLYSLEVSVRRSLTLPDAVK